MKVHFLKEDFLNEFKVNIPNRLEFYSQPTNDWIFSQYKDINPFETFKVEIKDFEFFQTDTNKYSINSKSLEDCKNTQRVFMAMKDISNSQASDERLWAGMAHYDFYDYMQHRWSGTKILKPSNIENRFFYRKATRDSMFRNTISRLFWVGKLVYDENREDPFELLDYFKSDYSTKSLVIFSYNFSTNPKIVHALLSTLITLEKQGFTYGKEPRDVYITAEKYLNILGGTRILDYMDESELSSKILNYMHNL